MNAAEHSCFETSGSLHIVKVGGIFDLIQPLLIISVKKITVSKPLYEPYQSYKTAQIGNVGGSD